MFYRFLSLIYFRNMEKNKRVNVKYIIEHEQFYGIKYRIKDKKLFRNKSYLKITLHIYYFHINGAVIMSCIYIYLYKFVRR